MGGPLSEAGVAARQLGGLGRQAGLGQPLSAGDKLLTLSPQSPGWGHGQSLRPDGMNTAAVRGCLAGCPEGAIQLVININFSMKDSMKCFLLFYLLPERENNSSV